MRRFRLAASVVALALALPGCLSLGGEEAPAIRRHSIDLPALTGAAREPAFGPIVVRPLGSRARYGPKVLVVDGPGRVTYLELERWVEDPPEAVTTVLRESLAASGAFEAVAAATSEMQTDLVLDGSLLACDVLREPDAPWRARLVVRLEVTERSSGEMVAAAAFGAEHDLPGQSAEGLGEAMGACLSDVVAQALARWEARHAAKRAPASNPFD